MKLLSLKLNGQYKGLKDQYFDFSRTQGNIVALIGLNGSGKSQILEVIAEAFAFLERCQRDDFVVRTPLRFGFELVYQLSGTTEHDLGSPGMELGSPLAVCGGVPNPIFKVVLGKNVKTPQTFIWSDEAWAEITIEELELPYVIGYSSGLNENLQRSFMKNTVQYFDAMSVRLKRKKELEADLDDAQISSINHRYWKKYPHIFSPEDSYFEPFYLADGESDKLTDEEKEQISKGRFLLGLRENPTKLSQTIYIDYDSVGLALASLALLPQQETEKLLQEVTYKYPQKLVLLYDLRRNVAGEDEVRDIKLLARIAGETNIRGVGRKTSDEQYDLYELDFLAGEITLDLTNRSVLEMLSEASYGQPLSLFRRLFKLQQLGAKNWQGVTRQSLRKDYFIETVKKPLKTKLPLAVKQLVLANDTGNTAHFDDLSDGEAQLIQVLATTRIFSAENTLFLLDEPETHLNPSWRTYFHNHLSKSMFPAESQGLQSQVFLSTHSPFMVSSLKREDVLFFERKDDGSIQMEPVDTQTYGASFEVLIKEHFGLRSLISQTVVETVKEYLPKDQSPEAVNTAREWIESNLGDSMEKAYLLRKLQS
ncbi:AAA family ATPase [Vibrio parahaemolyticus]|uniref:AAA family ATPase n=4 Tax=Vibrio parahaemolyticus TaxID=670 RepID=UPI00112426B2|nr:AAA family ATPase [Vibrio parahaemolyticus]TOO92133.1 AAA family ATPase [Vibrio parahaemolyticus]TOQ68385.1 AAA family ATPase [Vibrio parahaemolyticus]